MHYSQMPSADARIIAAKASSVVVASSSGITSADEVLSMLISLAIH